MREVITVFQDYKTSLTGYEKHFENILSFKEIVGSQNCILEANGDFRMSHYVGCLIKGNTCLQVLPKIYSNNIDVKDKNEIKESLEFIYRLLLWSDFLKVKGLDESSIEENDDSLIEIIIRIFVNRFLSLHQKNVYREYISQDVDQLYVRGKILFVPSVLKQVQKPGYLRVQCDEFSINNLINRIIKTTIQQLLFVTSNSENKKLLRLGLSYLDEVDLIHLHKEVFGTVVFNRMNEDYQPLIELSEMLFQNLSSGLNQGNRNTVAFIVPLNILFEKFFHSVLQSIYPSPERVVYQSTKYLATNSSGNKNFYIQPDFVIFDKSEIKHILDTKFKNPYIENNKLKITATDLYQVCTYAMRYNCLSIYLVYPLFKGQDKRSIIEQYSIPNDQKTITLSIIQIDITEINFDNIVQAVKKINGLTT
ncbi:McrC family protein [bacterium]|nr:McrC family protein [bacterium]